MTSQRQQPRHPHVQPGRPPVPHDRRREQHVHAARLAMEERREMLEEKRWDRYMRNMMMIINMQRMMGAQALTIGDPSGMHAWIGAIREEPARLLKDYDDIYDYYPKRNYELHESILTEAGRKALC